MFFFQDYQSSYIIFKNIILYIFKLFHIIIQKNKYKKDFVNNHNIYE
jgi:hypothetical protein